MNYESDNRDIINQVQDFEKERRSAKAKLHEEYRTIIENNPELDLPRENAGHTTSNLLERVEKPFENVQRRIGDWNSKLVSDRFDSKEKIVTLRRELATALSQLKREVTEAFQTAGMLTETDQGDGWGRIETTLSRLRTAIQEGGGNLIDALSLAEAKNLEPHRFSGSVCRRHLRNVSEMVKRILPVSECRQLGPELL